MHTREEFVDLMKVFLAGRAAEEVVFGRITNGAANDLERVTEIARSMVFEFGMSEVAPSRTMRADNYALSEETKRLRDSEQARLTDHAYAEATAPARQAPRGARPRRDGAAREGDARSRTSSRRCSRTWCPSRARPRRSGPCARSAHARLTRRAGSIARRVRGIHHLGVAVDRSRRGDRDLRAPLRRTARAPRAARRAGRRGRVDARRREPLRARQPDGGRHAGRSLPRAARAGHAPRRARERRPRGDARRARVGGRAADRPTFRGRGCSGSRSRSSIPIPSTAFSRRWLRVADDLVRIEIGLDGGQILSALVSAASADALERQLGAGAVADGRAQAEDGDDPARARRGSLYAKRFARETRVGFDA